MKGWLEEKQTLLLLKVCAPSVLDENLEICPFEPACIFSSLLHSRQVGMAKNFRWFQWWDNEHYCVNVCFPVHAAGRRPFHLLVATKFFSVDLGHVQLIKCSNCSLRAKQLLCCLFVFLSLLWREMVAASKARKAGQVQDEWGQRFSASRSLCCYSAQCTRMALHSHEAMPCEKEEDSDKLYYIVGKWSTGRWWIGMLSFLAPFCVCCRPESYPPSNSDIATPQDCLEKHLCWLSSWSMSKFLEGDLWRSCAAIFSGTIPLLLSSVLALDSPMLTGMDGVAWLWPSCSDMVLRFCVPVFYFFLLYMYLFSFARQHSSFFVFAYALQCG